VAVVGLIAGSFLNVCIYRIPKNFSIVFPPSRCPKCKAKLKVKDLFPVFSYIFLKGKCRYCKRPVSLRYPAVELLTSALFIMLFMRYGFSLDLLFLIPIFALLIVISFIDIEHMIIHDSLVIGGICLGLLHAAITNGLYVALAGMCFGFVFLFSLSFWAKFVLKKDSLGDGDIKLIIMLGSFLGLKRIFICIFAGSIVGAVVGVTLILLKAIGRNDQIPFAPFLSLGALIAVML
jgi:leader peptidase (prepilin peptidase)/N-methyltransferase